MALTQHGPVQAVVKKNDCYTRETGSLIYFSPETTSKQTKCNLSKQYEQKEEHSASLYEKQFRCHPPRGDL